MKSLEQKACRESQHITVSETGDTVSLRAENTKERLETATGGPGGEWRGTTSTHVDVGRTRVGLTSHFAPVTRPARFVDNLIELVPLSLICLNFGQTNSTNLTGTPARSQVLAFFGFEPDGAQHQVACRFKNEDRQ